MSCFLPLNPSIQRRWRRLHALDRVMMERSRTAGGFEKRTSLFLLFGATNIHPTMVRSYVCGYIFLIYWLVLLLYQKDNCQKLPKSYNLASIGLFGGAFQLRLLWTIKPVTFDMEGAGYCACLEFEERDVLLTLNPKKLPSNVHVCAAGCTEMAHPDVQNRISNKHLDLWRPLAKKTWSHPRSGDAFLLNSNDSGFMTQQKWSSDRWKSHTLDASSACLGSDYKNEMHRSVRTWFWNVWTSKVFQNINEYHWCTT